jgi:putative addiction module CopG family antidote
MNKITIELPPVLAEFLERQVEAGLYNSAADAIEDAVRKFYNDDGFRIEAVRAALAPGVAEADAGVYFEGTIDDIIADAKATRSKQK